MTNMRKPTKPRKGDDPQYREWLKAWPCYVCMVRWCLAEGFDMADICLPARRAIVALETAHECGPTHVAHVGVRGLSQKCPDQEAMPLGKAHHLHLTAGGGPESHHTLGRRFWEHHDLNRPSVLRTLQHLYWLETGEGDWRTTHGDL